MLGLFRKEKFDPNTLPVIGGDEELLPLPVSYRPFPYLGSWFKADWDVVSWKNHDKAIEWWREQELVGAEA